MRKLCSNRGNLRVIAAAKFYPETMYDKLNYRLNKSLRIGCCSALAESPIACRDIHPANELEMSAIKQIG